MRCINRYEDQIMIAATEYMVIIQSFLVDETGNFQPCAINGHQCRKHGNFHTAVIQVACTRKYAGTITDEKDRICLHLQAEKSCAPGPDCVPQRRENLQAV